MRPGGQCAQQAEAFRAVRYSIEHINERERSDALMLLMEWMAGGT